MGNCQAAEAATVVIVHPGGGGNRVERIYWSVSANEIMNSNPGHYVAQVVTPTPAAAAAKTTENGAAAKQLKLLRPDDTLVIGQVYRLVSFEDVLKEFDAKKCVKLGKLLKERGSFNNLEPKKNNSGSNSKSSSVKTEKQEEHRLGSGGGCSSRGGGRQWRPALQSISELGT